MDRQVSDNGMSRREFLRRAGVLAGALALAGCAAPTPEVIEKEVVVEKEVPVTVEVEKEKVVTATPAVLAPATLNIWINWSGTYLEAIQQIIVSFTTKYPQIEVELLPSISGAEGSTKFLASIAGGNPPDLYTTHSSDGGMFTSKDVLLPLNDYMATSRVSADQFFEDQLNLYTRDGKLYGLPSIEGAAGQAICWNKAHFTEVGLDPDQGPKTYDEISEWAEMLDQFDAAGNVLRLGFDPRDGRGWSLIDWWFNRKWYDPETHKLNIDTPDMVWGAEWVAGFAKRIGPEKISAFRQVYTTYTHRPTSGFGKGVQSMHMGGYYVPLQLTKRWPDLDLGYTWVPTRDGKKVTTMRGWFWVMPRGCPNPDTAWKFIEHATSVEAAFTIFNIAASYPSYKPFLEKADFSGIPGLQWFVDSPFEAAEIYIAPPLPISSDEVDDRINAGLDEMSLGRISGQEMLTRTQEEVQKLIDQALAVG